MRKLFVAVKYDAIVSFRPSSQPNNPFREGVSFCYRYFFIQAEDGIRVRTVTGVQTCALPICVGARALDRVLERRAAAGRAGRVVAAAAAAVRVGRGYALDVDEPLAEGKLVLLARRGREEIGRASCRERVEVAGARGTGRKYMV